MNLTIHARASRRAERLLARLDRILPDFESGDATEALSTLLRQLHRFRTTVSDDEWLEAAATCREHPLFGVLQEDPYTARAYDKPRGYAGDAEMLDYVYLGPPPGLSVRGKALLRATTDCTTGRSVRWRRDLMAREIDNVARAVAGARILSVGCGHLREARLAPSVHRDRVHELVALDQDPLSIARVREEHADLPVTPVLGSVGDILRGRLDLAGFDLIYAAGLYDYLSNRKARALTRTLVAALVPGGRLLVGNFTPDNVGRGYMEAFMDWHVVCRTRDDLAAMAEDAGCASADCFFDPWENIAYLRLTTERVR